MKKSIVLLLMVLCAPFLVMAQNVVDDLYYIPSKTKKEEVKAAEQKTEADAARKTVVVKSGTPAATVTVPAGTKVVVKGNRQNKRNVDEYNRRYANGSNGGTVSNETAVVNGDTNYDEELDGEWVNGFDGNADDYEYATRIIRFRNPRFAISISSPYYWDVVYGLNSWEWNVFVDDYYAYVFPTFTNRLWYDWRFSTVGWGWYSTWYSPWHSPWYYTSWYSGWGWGPWHGGWYSSWYSPWYSPWYTGWYGGWYAGWHGPHHYYGWGGYHYRPQNVTFRGQPGARSSYSSNTRRGVGGSSYGVGSGARSSVRTRNNTAGVRSDNGTVRSATRSNAGRVIGTRSGTAVRSNSTGVRSNSTGVRSNSTGVRSNSTGVRSNAGTSINTRSGATVRSSSSNNAVRSRSYTPSGSTSSNRSYSTGSSSSPRVRSYSGASSGSTRSYSGSSSSSRSYSGGGFSSGGATRSSGGGFSGGGGGGGSRGGGGGGGTRTR
ncbi:MAG: hypothetical protein IJ628_00310 [Bacteroidaceae bacterium]|nr:hypothetical protein [Bacteroidaceae bacterium]